MSEILSDFPVTDLLPPGRHGRSEGEAGVIADPVTQLGLALVVARKGKAEEMARAALETFGIALVDAPKVSFAGDVSFVGVGPGRWLVSAAPGGETLLQRLAERFSDCAAITDQSDANLVLDLYGPQVSAALEKLVPLDLHPSAFGPADAAATLVALIPLTFWQLNDAPAYRFAVPRSFAPAFLRALASAAAAYGLEMAGPQRG